MSVMNIDYAALSKRYLCAGGNELRRPQRVIEINLEHVVTAALVGFGVAFALWSPYSPF